MPRSIFRSILRRLSEHPLVRVGPGLITGAADDDPSGIATYSQAGAQFGLNMLWTMVISYPLMSSVQSLCARIGRVTGRGLAANIQQAFPAWVLYSAVCLLLIANTLNIAADVATMSDVLALMVGANRHLLMVGLTLLSMLMQIFIPYHKYVNILKWLTLSLLSYAAVLFTVHVPWSQVALRTVAPKLTFNAATATVIVGVFGTTISPYLFFWQCSEEVEDLHARRGGCSLLQDPTAASKELRRIRWDTWSGMLYSNMTAFFIILATALTLHAAGVTDIQTAAQAASALRPLAGDFAFSLFALGIIGVGLVGVPVLAGSGGYALADAQGWPNGLEIKPNRARKFYAVIAASMLIGLALGFTPINPIKALFYSAVINGVVAVPLIVIILLLAARRSVMGAYTAGRGLLVLGWITAALMACAAAGMLLPANG